MTEVAMSRIDEIEARANTDLAVERNGYQPTEMMGVQQQYFVRIQKETLELIATIRALQEENEGLRLENAELDTRCKPDLFWDDDAPEQSWSNPEEIAQSRWDYDDDPTAEFGLMTVRRAASMPDQEYLWQRIPREGCSLNDFKLTEITDEQCGQILAAQVVGDFARAALKDTPNAD